MGSLSYMINLIIIGILIILEIACLYLICTELLHRIQQKLISYSYKPPIPLVEKHTTKDIIKQIITTECDIRRLKKQIQEQIQQQIQIQISLQTKSRYKKVD